MLVCLVIIIAVAIPGNAVNAGKLLPYESNDDVVGEELYTLPDLPYDYNGLEPYLDEATLNVHHTGHLAGYTKKLNAVLKSWRQTAKGRSFDSILDILENIGEVPTEYLHGVRNFGGGFVNHNIYFSVMSPASNHSTVPVGEVGNLIVKTYGNFQAFKDRFTSQALSLFGSGYVWLCQKETKDPTSGASSLQLSITETINQDCPLSNGLQPILTLDVWEHAYYLKHQYRRAKHIEDWWNVVNWDAVQSLSDYWLQRSASKQDEL